MGSGLGLGARVRDELGLRGRVRVRLRGRLRVGVSRMAVAYRWQ